MEIRASDDDRERTVAALQQHTGAGRLTIDEFTERVDAACAARTLGELGALTRDLPVAPACVPAAGPDGHGHRELLLVFLIAAVTLVLLFAFLAVSRG